MSGCEVPTPLQNSFIPPPDPVDSIFGVLKSVFFNFSLSENFEEAKKLLDDFLAIESNTKNFEAAAEAFAETLKNGGRILSCGNGGSMCDSIHFAEAARDMHPDINIILMSGNPIDLANFADDFSTLDKPFGIAELKRLLESA